MRREGEDEPIVVAGLDLGGSHSVCLAAAGDGRIIGRGRGGAASLISQQRETVLDSVRQSLAQATAGLPEGVSGICRCFVGAAGSEQEAQRAVLTGILREAGLHCPLTITHDAGVALAGASLLAPGIIIMAGTGSIAFGRDRYGHEVRSGGWGPLLGDEGSAYDIGLRAIRAVLRSLDGREGPTALKDLVVAAFGLDGLEDFYRFARRPGLDRVAVAGLSRGVADYAGRGDPTACRIMAEAAAELVLAAGAVAERLDFAPDGPLALTYGGGLFAAGEPLITPLLASMRQWNPRAFLSPPVTPPVVGAVLQALALENLAREETIEKLVDEWKRNGGD